MSCISTNYTSQRQSWLVLYGTAMNNELKGGLQTTQLTSLSRRTWLVSDRWQRMHVQSLPWTLPVHDINTYTSTYSTYVYICCKSPVCACIERFTPHTPKRPFAYVHMAGHVLENMNMNGIVQHHMHILHTPPCSGNTYTVSIAGCGGYESGGFYVATCPKYHSSKNVQHPILSMQSSHTVSQGEMCSYLDCNICHSRIVNSCLSENIDAPHTYCYSTTLMCIGCYNSTRQ